MYHRRPGPCDHGLRGPTFSQGCRFADCLAGDVDKLVHQPHSDDGESAEWTKRDAVYHVGFIVVHDILSGGSNKIIIQ